LSPDNSDEEDLQEWIHYLHEHSPPMKYEPSEKPESEGEIELP